MPCIQSYDYEPSYTMKISRENNILKCKYDKSVCLKAINQNE